jgi:hypothetical protein
MDYWAATEKSCNNIQRRYPSVRVGAQGPASLQRNVRHSDFPKPSLLQFHQSTTLFIRQLSKLTLLKGDFI